MIQAGSPTHRRRPSPALLAAMLALVVSLGGTAAAVASTPDIAARQVVTTIYKLAAGDTVQVGIGQDAGV